MNQEEKQVYIKFKQLLNLYFDSYLEYLDLSKLILLKINTKQNLNDLNLIQIRLQKQKDELQLFSSNNSLNLDHCFMIINNRTDLLKHRKKCLGRHNKIYWNLYYRSSKRRNNE